LGKTVELGGFEIIHKVGEGGMGVVYKARQKSLDRIVAVKVLPSKLGRDTKFVTRFAREARSSAKLNHSNVVQVFDVGIDRGLHYLAMEYVDGPNIKTLLKQGKVFKEREALKIVKQIARALQYAEGVGVLHRDVKPDNILLTSSGIAKLSDLGLAKHLGEDSGLTVHGTTLGTPDYMSPEQAKGAKDLDIRSDLYSLGVTLFHMVTGKPPFTGDAPTIVMLKHINESPPDAHKLNPKLSRNCAKLISTLLRKKREQRIQTPAELIGQIDEVLSGGSPESAKRPAPKRRRADPVPAEAEHDWNKVLMYGGAVLGVLLLVAAGVAIMGRSRGRLDRRAAFEPPPREREREKPVKPPADETPVEAEPPSSGDDPSDLEKMLSYVQEWEKTHLNDFDELLSRYEKVKKTAEGTAAEFEIGDRVDMAMQAVIERQAGAAEAEWARLEGETAKLVEAGNYDAAIKVLTEVPEGLTKLIGERASARVDELDREAEQKINAAAERARRLLADGKPGDGLKVLAKVEGIRYTPAGNRIEELKAKLSSARVSEAETRREQQRAETATRLTGLLERFNEALTVDNNIVKAREVLATAGKDRSFRSLRNEIAGLKDVLVALEEMMKLERHALQKLLGNDVCLKTKDGREVEGIVQKVDEDAIHVEVPLPGGMGSAVMPVKIGNLTDQEKKKSLGDYKPETGAQKVAAAIDKIRKDDLSGAAEILGTVESFPLAAAYRKLLRTNQIGEEDAAAEEAWRTIRDFSPKNTKLTRGQGKKLLSLLAEFEETHLSTEFGRSVSGEVPALKRRAEDAVAGFSIQKLFKGKVERFDSETRAISLLYDFSDETQLEDWAGNISKYTGIEVHASTPRDPPGNAMIKDGRVTRARAPGELQMQSRAEFEGDIEYSVLTGSQFGLGGGPGILYWNPGTSTRFYYIRFRTEKNREGAFEAVAAHGMTYSVATESKPFTPDEKKQHRHTMIVRGAKLTYTIDDKPYISDWWPKHETWIFKEDRPRIRPFVILSTYGAQNRGVDEMTIVGTLRKEWLDENVREFEESGGVRQEEEKEESPGAAAAIQRLFNGKVESYDPETGRVSLFYDFKDSDQGKDWSGEVPVGFKRATRCHKVVFSGDVDFSVEGDPKEGVAAVWRKNGDAKWSLLTAGIVSSKGGRRGRKGSRAAQIYQFNPGYHTVEEPYEQEQKKKRAHSIRLSEGEFPTYWIDGEKAAAGELAVSTGEVRVSLPSFRVTNVRIRGSLDKKWVQQALE